MKLQKTSQGQYTLTLPKPIVEAKGWDKGTELELKFNERGNLEIQEKKWLLNIFPLYMKIQAVEG